MESVTRDQARAWVLHKQGLGTPPAEAKLAPLVERLGGLHATLVRTPFMSTWARRAGFVPAELEQALYRQRTLLRVRCVRMTFYIQPVELWPALHAATSAPVIAHMRRVMQRRGVTLAQYERHAADILALLRGRDASLAEIKRELGLGQTASPIVNTLYEEGHLVRAQPKRGWQDHTLRYARRDEWFPHVDLQALSEQEGLLQVARHYLSAFGPASEEDLIWWLGVGKNKARAALANLEPELVRVRVDDRAEEQVLLRDQREGLLQARPEPLNVHLLPLLDGYLMGSQSRERLLDARDREWVVDRSGNATSTIVVNGSVAGVWDQDEKRQAIRLYWFREPTQEVAAAAWQRARELGRWLWQAEPQVERVVQMTPLTQRTAGGFMSPLREAVEG